MIRTYDGHPPAGRILAGLGAGAASLYVPRYLAEIAPIAIRGGIATLNQVNFLKNFPLPAHCRITMSQHQARQEDHGHDEPLQTFEYFGPIVSPVKNCIEQCMTNVTLSDVCCFSLSIQSFAWEQMISEKIALKSLGACQHEYLQALKTQKFGCTLENPESAIHVDVHSRRFTYHANLQVQRKSIQNTESCWGIAQCRWFISLSVGLYLHWHPYCLCSRLAICIQRHGDSANRLTWDFLVARHAGYWHHSCRCSGLNLLVFGILLSSISFTQLTLIQLNPINVSGYCQSIVNNFTGSRTESSFLHLSCS